MEKRHFRVKPNTCKFREEQVSLYGVFLALEELGYLVMSLSFWRMNLAVTWLKEENVSLGELASRLGYQSEAAFSRAFKRYIGVSPGAARRNGYTGNI